jgi:hypothetical protein
MASTAKKSLALDPLENNIDLKQAFPLRLGKEGMRK